MKLLSKYRLSKKVLICNSALTVKNGQMKLLESWIILVRTETLRLWKTRWVFAVGVDSIKRSIGYLIKNTMAINFIRLLRPNFNVMFQIGMLLVASDIIIIYWGWLFLFSREMGIFVLWNRFTRWDKLKESVQEK